MSDNKHKLGLWSATSLVAGNMIGSGIFMLPASLAMYGAISIYGWIFSSIGAIMLAIVFKNLSKQLPTAKGGPYAYTRAGLGEFPAFLVAWGYWISIWCTNAAIAVALVSYLTVFIPILAENSLYALSSGLAIVWFLTWLNTLNIKNSGNVQLITTILKLGPLLAVSVFGLFYIDIDNFSPLNVSTETDFAAITSTAALTLFAFLGLECATIPSGNIENPEKNVPRATMIGTGISIIVYILSSVSVMGIIPALTLQKSNAPFADAASIMWGSGASYLVAAGAIISTFGALNGWLLMQGQIPAAAAHDNVFPKIFGKENKNGMPATGLFISSILVSVLMSLNFSKGFAETFKFILLLSTLTTLLPYIFSTASYMIMMNKTNESKRTLYLFVALLALLFSIWAVAGAGQETVYWGFILLLCGIPFYIWMKKNKEK